MTKLNREEFKDNLNLFRGKIKGFSKSLNSVHLNILAIFSEIIKDEKEICNDETLEEFFNFISYIFLDLRSFYKYKTNETEKLDNFISSKNNEVEIHETITRIILNLSKRQQFAALFWEEFVIIDDLINYITNIAKEEFIKKIIEKERKKKNINDITNSFLSICENTLNILLNLIVISKFNLIKFDIFLEKVSLFY